MIVVSASQCRAARGLLKWSQPDLSQYSGVNVQTISGFEKEINTPTQRTLLKITSAFEKEGVELTSNNGVRKFDTNIKVLNGEEGIKGLFDDIYENSLPRKYDILIANNEEPTKRHGVMDYLDRHLERLKEAGIKERILCREGDTNFLGPVSAYRWVPEKYFCNCPTFIYGNKVAMLIWGPPAKVTIISNSQYAESIRNLFYHAWDTARIPDKK